ncbi:MaoC/PaaZ C-terminal domain-containing protein [Alkalimonas sp. MEB108]|uniref:MaoC/PaaZ C-terminal domain-containing protein n=1 Tax=Alkalimonas cellulosilytica TaxID=3058395 RepID=A0ABU7J8T0_9GAMM|nr:MaoC/PaaZ C-terminal domain-containing protein [Alkalimonas sp. MEB108]MEE2002640.1 MaoC/PaaZ C-terminal domain-containing protein [Alkalimonas sp. MEB108]
MPKNNTFETVTICSGPALPGLAASYLRALWAKGSKDAGPLRACALLEQLPLQQLQAYQQLCQWPQLSPQLSPPPCWLQLVSFPLQLKLVTHPRFPLPAMGLVHLENRIEYFCPLDSAIAVDFNCCTEAAQPHEKGRTVALITEARQAERLIWRSRAVYLQRLRTPSSRQEQPAVTIRYASQSAEWPLPVSLGWRYGRVSGDLNPIHLHPLLARLFGFTANIAHGMWSKARCLSELAAQGLLPEPPYQVEVRFAKPILLPAQVQLHWQSSGQSINFALCSADGVRCHLQGAVTTISR